MFEDRAEIRVNAFHHQLVRTLPPAWQAVALALDGGIEGFERQAGNFALGGTWHPQAPAGDDPLRRRLVAAFVEAAGRHVGEVTTTARRRVPTRVLSTQ